VRQAPQFAELGDIGEHLKIRLELQLVAHVGLLGFPSAGKSTLISHISAAKPKIGDYPFTTLVPNLGVVDLSRFGGDAHQSFVVADLPGLIEGASEGKGLGVRFLKHVSRTAVLLYVLDPFSYDNMTIEKQFEILGHELKNYDAELSKKTFWVAINKVDSIPEDDQKSLLKTFLKKFPKLKTRVQFISAITGTGLKELVFQLHKMVREEENKVVIAPPPADEIAYVPKFFVDEQGFSVALEGSKKLTDLGQVLLARSSHEDDTRVVQILRVKGARIEQIARMTNPEHDEGVERVYDVMKKMGIMRALVRAGIAFGDVIAVGPLYLEYHEL
jgi:GTP-binding protein